MNNPTPMTDIDPNAGHDAWIGRSKSELLLVGRALEMYSRLHDQVSDNEWVDDENRAQALDRIAGVAETAALLAAEGKADQLARFLDALDALVAGTRLYHGDLDVDFPKYVDVE